MFCRIAVIIVSLLAVSVWQSRAEAQTCPSDVQVVSGQLGKYQTGSPIAIDLLPCQTLVVEMTGSGSVHPSGNMGFEVRIRNSTQQQLAWRQVLCGVSCSMNVPSVAYLPGTRGVGGLAKDLVPGAQTCNWYSDCVLNYTLTIRKTPRPGFNIGGDSFANAPLVTAGSPQYGSLSDFEASGQYYRITLNPGQAIYVSGYVLRYGSPDGHLIIRLYDANFVDRALMANLPVGNGQTVTYPSGSSPPLYTHSGTTSADYYVMIRSGNRVLHEFQMIVEVPRLEVTPNPVTRGEQATFTIRGALGATISDWKYLTADNGIVNRSVNLAGFTWSGIMADSGTGRVTVSRGANSVVLETPLTVAPRSGWEFTARSASEESWPFTTPGNLSLDPADPPNGPYPVAGESGLDLAWSAASTNPIDDNGPNHDFKFVRTQLTDTGSIPTGFYWVLSPSVENTSSEFYTRQCGDYNSATQTGVFISGANLLAQTIRHEHGTMQSHHSQYVVAQNDPTKNLGVFAERAVAGPATTQASFNLMLTDQLRHNAESITADMAVEPYAVNYSQNGLFLGNINFAPNYATCP